jgi:hypothetical protein
MTNLRIGRIALVFVAAFAVSTAVAAGLLSLTLSTDPPPIHVRWKPATSEAERAELERRFGLRQGEFTEGTTYAYLLTDTSTDNIRALVQDPLVDDTANINRLRYRPSFANDRERRLIFFSVVAGGILSVLVMLSPHTWRKFGLLGS